MVKKININDVAENLDEIIAGIDSGDEVVLAKAGMPLFKLVKIEPEKPKKKFKLGSLKDALKEIDLDTWDDLDLKVAELLVKEKKWRSEIS